MAEKIKTDVDRLLLISKLKKSFRHILLNLKLFPILKSKVVYLRPFLFSLPFPKFSKENFMYCTLATNM